jgi:hypothetical protein
LRAAGSLRGAAGSLRGAAGFLPQSGSLRGCKSMGGLGGKRASPP